MPPVVYQATAQDGQLFQQPCSGTKRGVTRIAGKGLFRRLYSRSPTSLTGNRQVLFVNTKRNPKTFNFCKNGSREAACK